MNNSIKQMLNASIKYFDTTLSNKVQTIEMKYLKKFNKSILVQIACNLNRFKISFVQNLNNRHISLVKKIKVE